MSAKLIIHRFDNESKYQTLNISIENNNEKTETKVSTWEDVSGEPKKKEKDKSRLIIKVTSEENMSQLDLDSCAQKVDKSESFFNNTILQNPININTHYPFKDNTNFQLNKNFNNDYETFLKNRPDIEEQNEQYTLSSTSDCQNRYVDSPRNLLEYSLKRVKENNARIMENINILNRTLNYTYTKKKDHTPKILRSYPCEECGKGFVYENGLRRHYAVRHENLDIPRWQFVWTCAECFQVWPQRDLAVQHAKQCCKNDNTGSVQEIKTSSLLQCEFCEKVYTSIPRLLSHLKLHTVTNNYNCNACDIAFSCYKTAEQHWLVCTWLKMYYQFSLPKLLLCNACDRKFRNYDQLYNHRYKVGHFIPKSSNENNCTFIPLLVYQCEICGQWFNSIMQLQEHRNQYHPHSDVGIQHNVDLPTTEG